MSTEISIKQLARLEFRRISLKPHFIGLLIANIIILVLSVFVSTTLDIVVSLAGTGFPEITLDTISITLMLVRAVLIVWQAVLIAKIIIEEYQRKTIGLLYTYPVSRSRLIAVKLIVISGIILLFHTLSALFQHLAVYTLSNMFDFVSFNLIHPVTQIIIIAAAVSLGFVPLWIGLMNESTIATIVSSIVIVALSSNSQGSTAGLLSIPIIAVILGILGLCIAKSAVKKIVTADLNN